ALVEGREPDIGGLLQLHLVDLHARNLRFYDQGNIDRENFEDRGAAQDDTPCGVIMTAHDDAGDRRRDHGATQDILGGPQFLAQRLHFRLDGLDFVQRRALVLVTELDDL